MIRLLAICALTACGHNSSGGDDDDDTMAGTLSIDPATSEVVIRNAEPARVTFTATLMSADGTSRDVTADTVFGVDGRFGTFVENDLMISVAGKAGVSATYRKLTDTAEVTARLESVRVDPSLPPGTAGMFDGIEDAALAPQVVYPPVDSVMPRNLGDFEVHWTDSHANTVFEVSLHTEFTDVRVYVPGGNGVAAAGPTPSWTAFLAREWLTAVGLGTAVTFQVRGANPAVPGKVGAAPPQLVKLSNEDMAGGLYYWAATSQSKVFGIFRHDMARPGQPAEEFMTTNQTGGRCLGCHVLSRDGTRMAITYDGSNEPATMVDVGAAAAAPSMAKWNFGAFTPDSKQFLAIENSTLVVRDTETQALIATASSSKPVSHVDLSPDGKRVVYATNPSNFHDWDFIRGEIYTRTYSQSTRTFGPEQALVSDGNNNFYPSWSPDGKWILFAKDTSGASTYDAAGTSLWVLKGDGTQPPVELAAANQALGLTNTWPRWAPFPQTLGPAYESMLWITMSSKRDFGVRLRNTGLFQRPMFGTPAKRAQLWMTPFFPARAEAGNDPSTRAFRLPFQNLDSSNHIAQWTERVVIIE